MVTCYKLSAAKIRAFQQKVLTFYHEHARILDWRETKDPYAILVSEIMLQQTQVERVAPFYRNFMSLFPNLQTLADAPLAQILKAWQGLGYNRRALGLKKMAQNVVTDFDGKIPDNKEALIELPGIGAYTAAAVRAFAFDQPEVMIETNIRTVYLHEFLRRRKKVADAEILSLVEQTVFKKDPRNWYYALMDYGTSLKKEHRALNKKSKHYKTQSRFKGSNREIRGKIIKLLVAKNSVTKTAIIDSLDFPSARIEAQLLKLEKEGMLQRRGERLVLS